MQPEVHAAYMQLAGMGLLWVTFHCAGMCGPLLLGLGLGQGDRAPKWLHVLAYQAGKASIYMLLGALAGLLGRVVASSLQQGAPILSLMLGVGMLGWPLVKRLGGARPVRIGGGAAGGTWIGRILQAALRFQGPPGLGKSVRLGMAMSIIPCMVVAWVLTLAASTGSPFHGALLMLLLVVMNSLPLLTVVAGLPALLGQAGTRLAATLSGSMVPVSGVWLLLMSAAAFGFIPHASLGWSWAGQGYVLMFW